MAIQEIPKAYRYVCDGCGAFETQQNAEGHYPNSTPRNWATIQVIGYTGKSHEKLFCNSCGNGIIRVIENWKGK